MFYINFFQPLSSINIVKYQLNLIEPDEPESLRFANRVRFHSNPLAGKLTRLKLQRKGAR
jgi:hypothetical protein